MHEIVFACPGILARYRDAPLFAERERFLRHCAGQGYTRSGLQKICLVAAHYRQEFHRATAPCPPRWACADSGRASSKYTRPIDRLRDTMVFLHGATGARGAAREPL